MTPLLPILALLSAAPQEPPLPDGAAILALDQARADAEIARDQSALGRIVDERFAAAIGADPSVIDKPAYLRWVMAQRHGADTRADLTDRTLKVDGDMAVLLETARRQGGDRGAAAAPTAMRVMAVFVRRADGWKVFALHLAPMAVAE